MCDYSLLGVPNRLAVEGEELVLHRFRTGSLGLTECPALQSTGLGKQCANRSLWIAIKALFKSKQSDQAIAVCIPPGARLLVNGIPKDIQHSFGSQPTEFVTFTQLSPENMYRDAIRLDNGSEILLQKLRVGQRVRVLNLSSCEEQNPQLVSSPHVLTGSPNRG